MGNQIMYSIDEICKEMAGDAEVAESGDIILVKPSEKFFIGGGCEVTGYSSKQDPVNISVCESVPVL